MGNTCIAVAAADRQIAVPTAICSGSELANLGQATFPAVITTTTINNDISPVETAGTEVTLLAPLFQLNYRSSDLLSTMTSAVITSTTQSDISSTSSSPSSGASPPPPPGLSTGAAVGVGIGAALGGILLIISVVVGWVWVKKRKQSAAAAVPESPHEAQLMLEAQEHPDKYVAPPPSWARPIELHTERLAAELAVEQLPNWSTGARPPAPAELPAGT
jgi:hypothetical protein